MKRGSFFPPGVAESTGEDAPVSLGGGRWLTPQSVAATMLRALDLAGHERVLEIGTGTGYQAALLGRLAGEVCSVEIDEALVEQARRNLAASSLRNVRVAEGDASRGWAESAPYDAILVSAGASELPLVLLEQLEPGGRLVIPLGDDSGQLLERFQRHADSLESETIGACQLDMLVCPRRRTLSNFPWTARPGAK